LSVGLGRECASVIFRLICRVGLGGCRSLVWVCGMGQFGAVLLAALCLCNGLVAPVLLWGGFWFFWDIWARVVGLDDRCCVG